MNRRSLLIIVLVLVAVVAGAELWARVNRGLPSNEIAVAGDVRAPVWTVSAPAISYPAPNVAVGITATPTAAAAQSQSPTAPPNPMRSRSGMAGASSGATPVVSGLIEHMYVTQGDRVKKGQVLARFDDTMFVLGVAQAKTAAEKAHAQVAVIARTLDTIQTNQDKVANGKAKLAAGAATLQAALASGAQQLATAQAQINAGRAQLLAGRAKIQAGIAGVQALLHGPHPPTGAQLQVLLGQLKFLQAQLAGVNKALAGLAAGQAKLNAGKTALATGAAKGAAALATGRAQLATASTQLSKAKRQLQLAEGGLRYVAEGQDVLVDLAKFRMTQTIVRAPVDGVVTQAANAGQVVMVNSPLVRIRPDEPTRIDTYLTGDQLLVVPLGAEADVTYDSAKGKVFPGHVTVIAPTAEFPPTTFPTTIVHMTRTTKVTITLDGNGWAPPGTPVDVVLHTNTGQQARQGSER